MDKISLIFIHYFEHCIEVGSKHAQQKLEVKQDQMLNNQKRKKQQNVTFLIPFITKSRIRYQIQSNILEIARERNMVTVVHEHIAID